MADIKFKNENSQLTELRKWLMQLCGDEPCPDLHPDIHDIKHLLAFKRQNKESEKNVAEEIKLKKIQINDLNSKTDDMKVLLESENVSLSDDAWKQIESIAGLAAKMNLKEPDLTNLLLAICNMKDESIKNEEQKMNNCALMSSYSRQNLKIKYSNDVLKRQLHALKEVVEIQKPNKKKIYENINFFNTKCAEYESNIKLYKERLKEVNFEEDLQHSKLVEWAKVIEDLEKRLKSSMEKLKNYKKLPPNEKLTELKIREKKEEFQKLENEFTSIIEMWEKQDAKDA